MRKAAIIAAVLAAGTAQAGGLEIVVEGDASGTGDDDGRGDVTGEHRQYVLYPQGHGLANRGGEIRIAQLFC